MHPAAQQPIRSSKQTISQPNQGKRQENSEAQRNRGPKQNSQIGPTWACWTDLGPRSSDAVLIAAAPNSPTADQERQNKQSASQTKARGKRQENLEAKRNRQPKQNSRMGPTWAHAVRMQFRRSSKLGRTQQPTIGSGKTISQPKRIWKQKETNDHSKTVGLDRLGRVGPTWTHAVPILMQF